MKDWVINLLGGVTYEQYQRAMESMARYCNSKHRKIKRTKK